MKCAININKHTSDAALHQMRQLLATVCVCVRVCDISCYSATALVVSPRLVFDAR